MGRESEGVGEDREGGERGCLHHQRGIPGTQPSRPLGHGSQTPP